MPLLFLRAFESSWNNPLTMTPSLLFPVVLRIRQSPTELYNLLQAATKAHNTLTRDASMGKGYDRHVTGLRLVYNAEIDGEPPKLLVDPLLGESQTWRLSTSGLSAGDRFAGTGFGAGYEDGYGCNCKFQVSSNWEGVCVRLER